MIEDDSQDGADHVDAHRIPAFAISPYAQRGAVVHTRYDFLSFIRTLELVDRDGAAEPLRRDRGADVRRLRRRSRPTTPSPTTAITPEVDLLERNTAASRRTPGCPSACRSSSPTAPRSGSSTGSCGSRSTAPAPSRRRPGPNAAGIDERAWRRKGATSDEEALEEVIELLGLDEETIEERYGIEPEEAEAEE